MSENLSVLLSQSICHFACNTFISIKCTVNLVFQLQHMVSSTSILCLSYTISTKPTLEFETERLCLSIHSVSKLCIKSLFVAVNFALFFNGLAKYSSLQAALKLKILLICYFYITEEPMMDILYIFQFSESPISRGTFTNYEFFSSVTE